MDIDRGDKLMNTLHSDYYLIKDYVDNHYAHFGCYPMEVETDKQVYTFDEYWYILDAGEQG